MKARILIVEDVFIEAHALERTLLKAGYDVCAVARSVPEALLVLQSEHVDLVLLDILLKGPKTGIDLAEFLARKNIAFVYLSANSNRNILEKAKATKPYGFLVKPFREKDVLVTLDIAWYLHRQKGATKPELNSDQMPFKNTLAKPKKLIGKSSVHYDLFEQIKVAAISNISVLITGESGTGKELVAREIHALSERSNAPMLVVNCSALPVTLIEAELFGYEKGAFTGAQEKRTGKFEQADGGTIFLDEIGELPLEVQVKFLRVLQEKEIEPIGGKTRRVDVRIIAATNRELEDEIAMGRFRLDLYYRLNVFPIVVKPLRQRRVDIPLLVEHFIKRYGSESGKIVTEISPDVLSKLENHNWPGNVRELENLIFRSVLLTRGPIITQLANSQPLSEDRRVKEKTIAENERAHILSVLENCNWKISGKGGAAAILDIKVSTLNHRIKKLGIRKPK